MKRTAIITLVLAAAMLPGCASAPPRTGELENELNGARTRVNAATDSFDRIIDLSGRIQ